MLKRLDIEIFELFDLCKNGKLQAYNIYGKRIVDPDLCEKGKKDSLDKILRLERLKEGTKATGNVYYPGSHRGNIEKPLTKEELERKARKQYNDQPNVPIVPEDCVLFDFSFPASPSGLQTWHYVKKISDQKIKEAVDFKFKKSDVEKLEIEYGIEDRPLPKSKQFEDPAVSNSNKKEAVETSPEKPNDPAYFQKLNLVFLKDYAKSVVTRFSEIPFDRIVLYRYRNKHFPFKWFNIKYAMVFFVEDTVDQQSYEKFEAASGIRQTVTDDMTYVQICVDQHFSEAYKDNPPENYIGEWFFIPHLTSEAIYPGVEVEGRKWILYDTRETQDLDSLRSSLQADGILKNHNKETVKDFDAFYYQQLNLTELKVMAEGWANEFSVIKQITLYRSNIDGKYVIDVRVDDGDKIQYSSFEKDWIDKACYLDGLRDVYKEPTEPHGDWLFHSPEVGGEPLSKDDHVLTDSRLILFPNDEVDADNKSIPEKSLPNFLYEPETKWEDIKITLIDNNTVRIETPKVNSLFSYHELGMSDKRDGSKPTQIWLLLKSFAKFTGRIDSETGRYNPKRPDIAKRLNKHLKDLFGIKESIYKYHYKKHKAYITRIIFNDQTDQNPI